MNEYNDYLIHFGVKGMKWGVRKDKYKSADKATRKKYREEYKKTDEYKKKVNTAKKVAIGGAITLAAAASLPIAYQGAAILSNAIQDFDYLTGRKQGPVTPRGKVTERSSMFTISGDTSSSTHVKDTHIVPDDFQPWINKGKSAMAWALEQGPTSSREYNTIHRDYLPDVTKRYN